MPAHAPVGLTPRTLPALAAARLLHEAVLRQRPQVKSAVRRRLAEHLAGLRRGERPRVAQPLEQRPAQRVSQRPHGLRVRQVELPPIVGRTRAILVSASRICASPICASPICASPICASPICADPVLADRSIVRPAFALLRLAGSIFGSHVSKDYSRKSRFDKSSKHFF